MTTVNRGFQNSGGSPCISDLLRRSPEEENQFGKMSSSNNGSSGRSTSSYLESLLVGTCAQQAPTICYANTIHSEQAIMTPTTSRPTSDISSMRQHPKPLGGHPVGVGGHMSPLQSSGYPTLCINPNQILISQVSTMGDAHNMSSVYPKLEPPGNVNGNGNNGFPKTEPSSEPFVCAGCNNRITDRFLLRALEKYWHEDCLKCNCCQIRLTDAGETLYIKNNHIFCKRDYFRVFGNSGHCAACNKPIPACEMVMRARNNLVYHLECFACQECNHRFCVGDRFYLCDNKVLCQYHYDERMTFANMTLNYSSLAQLKRQIQQIEDLDEIAPMPGQR